ncbi:MAG: hypothetical protein PHV94_05755 [Bacilli bacterium]|nr:hypothetical protein [Bacilli bacterium]
METRIPTLQMMLDGVLARKFFEQYPEIDEDWDVILFINGIAYSAHLEDVLCFSCKVAEELYDDNDCPVLWCPAVDGELFRKMTVRKCKGDYYR